LSDYETVHVVAPTTWPFYGNLPIRFFPDESPANVDFQPASDFNALNLSMK
jgi:hypothetical protein